MQPGRINLTRKNRHAERREADAVRDIVASVAMLHYDGELFEGLFKSPQAGQQDRFVVENDAAIPGLIRCAERDAMLQILKRLRILTEFELA